MTAVGKYGGSLVDKGDWGSGSGGSNYPLRGQKNTLWEGGTRVPAFIHSPLLQNKSTVYHGFANHSDIEIIL